MKIRKASICLLTVSLLLVAALAGCNDQGVVNGEIPFDSTKVQNHIISMRQATEYTKRFRASRATLDSIFKNISIRQSGEKPGISTDLAAVANPLTLKNSEYFNRDAIAALLNQAGADGGIRIYLGQDRNGVVRLVLVPATGQIDYTDRKLARKLGALKTNLGPTDDGEAIEKGQECPEMCPDDSPLNQDN